MSEAVRFGLLDAGMVPEVTTKLLASDLYSLGSTLQTRSAGFDLSNALPIGEASGRSALNGHESEIATIRPEGRPSIRLPDMADAISLLASRE